MVKTYLDVASGVTTEIVLPAIKYEIAIDCTFIFCQSIMLGMRVPKLILENIPVCMKPMRVSLEIHSSVHDGTQLPLQFGFLVLTFQAALIPLHSTGRLDSYHCSLDFGLAMYSR
jgi:hypothetical protein